MNTKLLKISALAGLAALAALATGCINDGGSRKDSEANLVVVTGVKDVNKVRGLGKASTISLKKLIITLRSTDTTIAVRRDTVLADTGASFVSNATSDQTFSRSYKVNPLRTWIVVVKTLDAKDSVVHYDSATAVNLLAGETRSVTLNLSSRYVMYEAQFTLPDSINFTLSTFKQQLNVKRVVLRVDGSIVADSTRSPRFEPGSPTPTIHTVRFDYIRVNQTPDVRVEFYGKIGDVISDTTLLFVSEFNDVNPSTPNPPAVAPVYVGPDAVTLGNIATAGLVINIGKVGTVVFNTNINGNVAGKSSAQ
jgi:hypothetical protein